VLRRECVRARGNRWIFFRWRTVEQLKDYGEEVRKRKGRNGTRQRIRLALVGKDGRGAAAADEQREDGRRGMDRRGSRMEGGKERPRRRGMERRDGKPTGARRSCKQACLRLQRAEHAVRLARSCARSRIQQAFLSPLFSF